MKTLLTITIACLMGISVAAQVHSTLYLQGSYSKPQNADGVLKQYFTGDHIWQDETARQLAATEISGVTSGVVGMEWYSGHITYGFRNQLGI
ncbi:MAG: hypothetical protein KDC12_02365, partial [Flavobacteriales bacterium]|nr:hypothetical protein [Flavobacteriales bacterium]